MPASSTHDTRDGVIVGLIAYATVAVFYVCFDVLAARGTLYTVNLLGRTVLRGLRDATVLQYPLALDLPAMFVYNGMHLVSSILIGIVVVRFVGHAERNPSKAIAMTALIAAGFVATIGVVGWLSAPIRAVLPWWSIVVANTAAVVIAAAYLVRTRPGVVRRMIHA